MFGWSISIEDRTFKEPLKDYRSRVLAEWEIKPSAVPWLKDLLKAGKVTERFEINDDYWRHKILARDILPLIADGPPASGGHVVLPQAPDRPVPEAWISGVIFHTDRIASCPEDQELLLDVADKYDGDLGTIIDEVIDECDGDLDIRIADREISQKFIIALPREGDPTAKDWLLAAWETGACGTEWLKDLVKAGKASVESNFGYPDTYTILAADILPLVKNGPPPDDTNSSLYMYKVWDVVFRRDRIAACPPDRVLTVTVWDLS